MITYDSNALKGSEMFSYFQICKDFDSLFIATTRDGIKSAVLEIKNINDEFDQISFVPLGEEPLEYEKGDQVRVVNEANNISFTSQVESVHAGRWVTTELPDEVRLVNLRQNPRTEFPTSLKAKEMTLFSYGEEGGSKVKASYEGDIIDISEQGLSFKIKARRIDGLYRHDKVEIRVSDKIAYLSKVKGRVVHKSLCHMNDPEKRCYKIGVQFDGPIKISF